MNNSFTTDELKALAKFPFEDPQWKIKFLIGGLIIFAGYIIPWLPMIFVYGYCAQIMYRIIVEKGTPYLPNWDNWDKLLIDGLKIFGASFVYSLPFLLIFFGGMGLFVASIISLEAAPNEPEAVSSIMGLFPVIGMMAWFGSFSLGMILALAIGVILPVAIAHMIAANEFAAAFRVREWWAIFRANWMGYLIAYVLILGFWMVLSVAMQILYFTIIFCCLVPFVMIFVVMYVMVIGSVLFAKTYRTGSEKLAAQTVVP